MESAVGRRKNKKLEKPSLPSSSKKFSFCPSITPMEKIRISVQASAIRSFSLFALPGTRKRPARIPAHITSKIITTFSPLPYLTIPLENNKTDTDLTSVSVPYFLLLQFLYQLDDNFHCSVTLTRVRSLRYGYNHHCGLRIWERSR